MKARNLEKSRKKYVRNSLKRNNGERKKLEERMLNAVSSIRKEKLKRAEFKEKYGKNAYRKYMRSEEWKKLRAIYYSFEANKRCMICGTEENLNVHHASYSLLGDRREILALRTVCAKHHLEIHELEENSKMSLGAATNHLIPRWMLENHAASTSYNVKKRKAQLKEQAKKPSIVVKKLVKDGKPYYAKKTLRGLIEISEKEYLVLSK